MTGQIHAMESLSAKDGPGLRQVVFLQGCPLRCRYCHNPDAWPVDGGETVDTDHLMRQLIRIKPYLDISSGITFSGGEPLLQPMFLLELLFECKKAGFHTAVDTSGWQLQHICRSISQSNRVDIDKEAIECLLTAIVAQTDLFLIDIKAVESIEYQLLTGYNCTGRDFLIESVTRLHKPVWLRHVLVPGWNTGSDHLRKLTQWVCQKVDQGLLLEQLTLLPYHRLAEQKYEQLGLPYGWSDVPALSLEELDRCVTEIRSEAAKQFGNKQQLSFSVEYGL